MAAIFIRLSMAVIKHQDKATWRERVGFILSVQVTLSLEQVRVGTEAMGEPCPLACSSRLVQTAFLGISGPPSQDGTTHAELGPATSVINQGSAPTDLPTSQSTRYFLT